MFQRIRDWAFHAMSAHSSQLEPRVKTGLVSPIFIPPGRGCWATGHLLVVDVDVLARRPQTQAGYIQCARNRALCESSY